MSVSIWVLVSAKDYSIVQEGLFCELVGKDGHLMTKEYYYQVLDERK